MLRNNTAVVTIPSNPKDIVLTMKPDGTFVGPGPITVHGTVTVGHRTETYSTGTTDVVEYRDATRVCPPPVLTSKGAAPSAVDISTGALKSMFNNGDQGPPTPPGLRMHGSYGGQGGIEVEFYPESAVISCGDAAHAYPYVVQVRGALPVITFQNPARPIVLAMKADGDLDSGSGPYEILGRTITAQDDNGDFTFTPLNATCNLGALTPGATPAAPPATIASASGTAPVVAKPLVSTPNAPLGNAVLTVASGFPAQPNAANPLAGAPYTLLRDDFANALGKGGIQVPSGTSPFKVYVTACQNRTPDCQKIAQIWRGNVISAARGDMTGKATLPGVPPGTYYLTVTTRYHSQPMEWNLKLDLEPGSNSITIYQRNASGH